MNLFVVFLSDNHFLSLVALKCEIKKLAKTKSEAFSCLCEETVTYGEVLATMVGFVALMAFVALSGFIAGGEVM